jgi:hypothetical protein
LTFILKFSPSSSRSGKQLFPPLLLAIFSCSLLISLCHTSYQTHRIPCLNNNNKPKQIIVILQTCVYTALNFSFHICSTRQPHNINIYFIFPLETTHVHYLQCPTKLLQWPCSICCSSQANFLPHYATLFLEKPHHSWKN